MNHGRAMTLDRSSKAIWTMFLLSFSLLLLASTGCGDGKGVRIPVSGNVTIDGKPVGFGRISFEPIDKPGKFIGGSSLGTDGSYQVTTFTAFDGLPPGKYQVTITATEAMGDSGERWHAPKKYSMLDKSGLTAEVNEETKTIDFELTWKGDKKSAPFVVKF